MYKPAAWCALPKQAFICCQLFPAVLEIFREEIPATPAFLKKDCII